MPGVVALSLWYILVIIACFFLPFVFEIDAPYCLPGHGMWAFFELCESEANYKDIINNFLLHALVNLFL